MGTIDIEGTTRSEARSSFRPPPRASCALCTWAGSTEVLLPAETIQPQVSERISAALGRQLSDEEFVCRRCATRHRLEHALERLKNERGTLSAVEHEVARRAADHASIVEDTERALDRERTFGQRVADTVAAVGGSWAFVLGFLGFLGLWIAVNAALLRSHSFDPYPFILLNLVLSCIAALQAPIIMMSQNRTSERDRARAVQDYRVNLKAEIEIAALHEKVDHLLHAQWENMVELQELQLEMLQQIGRSRRPRRS